MSRFSAVALLLLALPAAAQPGWEPEGFRFSGYVDMLYSHFDFGPDQASGPEGSPQDSRAVMDLQRFVLGLDYELDPTMIFAAEIEFEHGGAGGALELEYEEFGEYETEIEKGGEVVLEQLHLTKTFGDGLGLRVGHVLVPVCSLNAAHLPTDHFGTIRPEAETAMIPATWHETGLEAFGAAGDVEYRVLLVNGLDSTGFSSKHWARDGHQTRFEQVRADELAVAARLSWRGVRGLNVSVSGYRGDTAANRPKNDMDGQSAVLTLLGADVRLGRGPLRARACYLHGFLDNAATVSAKNGRLSTNLGVARTPVASESRAWSVEAGYDVMPWLAPRARAALLPFVRLEGVDTMHAPAPGQFDNPRFDRTVTTFGLNWFPAPTVVIKSDCSIRSLGADKYRDETTLSLSVGLVL